MLQIPAIILTSLLLNIISADTDKDIIRDILYLQDQRMISDGKLFKYLEHSNPEIRFIAAIALANIQDSSAIPYLILKLNDPVTDVREGVAFALGQIGSAGSEKALLEGVKKEENPKVTLRLFEALGKSGSIWSLEEIIKLERPKELVVEGERALAIGRYAIRGVKSDRATQFIFEFLSQENPEVRWKSLYALWRIAPSKKVDSLISGHTKQLQTLSNDTSADVLVHLATLLGRSESIVARDLLLGLTKKRSGQANWRVEVQLARSLSTWAKNDVSALEQLIELLNGSSEHIVLSTLNGLSTLPPESLEGFDKKQALRSTLLSLAGEGKFNSVVIQGEAIVAVANLFPSDFTFRNWLTDSRKEISLLTKVVQGIALLPTRENSEIIQNHLTDERIRVAMSAWENLPKLLRIAKKGELLSSTKEISDFGKKIVRSAREGMGRNDMALTTVIAATLRDSILHMYLKMSDSEEFIINDLISTYRKLSSTDDIEAMQSILETFASYKSEKTVSLLKTALKDNDRTIVTRARRALSAITGEDYSHFEKEWRPPVHSDYSWDYFDSIPQRVVVRMFTAKGIIEIEMLIEYAPFSVMNFLKLFEKKFYDGLTFHRVVPNFVIQGGDPRGDGWGGPGYSIRSEFGLINYSRGMVGIASAGKDTEGCQFFITHSPQPHLDGRYTIFGRVLSGMDVVDRIQVGDKIDSLVVVGR